MIIKTNQFKEYRKAIGLELWLERRRRGINLHSLSQRLKITPKEIDKLELGRGISITVLVKLLQFYNKKIKVELVE